MREGGKNHHSKARRTFIYVTNNHKASALACCPTKINEKRLKIENENKEEREEIILTPPSPLSTNPSD